jgi:hypothetical protein
MISMQKRKGWRDRSLTVAAAAVAAGLQLVGPSFETQALAGYELPPGERITNLPAIPRALPQKEAYENYDPVIGRNFDVKNLWLRADLRVRPEFRNGVCFGGGGPAGGACNTLAGSRTNTRSTVGGPGANDFFVQQMTRLGIGYDLSPDVNFYMELIASSVWGANGDPNNAGNGGDPLNHSGGTTAGRNFLGVRAAYVLVRNLAGVQGLSMKAGRQYIVFGNHSIFGHFDWANTGYSHDGVMFNYNANKNWETWFGWFRNSETDLAQGSAVGSAAGNVAGGAGGGAAGCGAAGATGCANGGGDADMFIFYNQIKSVPGWLIEPYYIYYRNNLQESANGAQGLGTAKHSQQSRHHFGLRSEMRKGNWDFINETGYQGGTMADAIGTDNNRNLTINAWATRNWLGYTMYENKWKPRFAIGLDYASGDGNANCNNGAAGRCSTANTFENFFPTNHIHMGYMDVQAWKNMISPQFNFQARPSAVDHIEFWYSHLRLANARDNWYRGSQGAYVFSNQNNTSTHIGDETDVSWTRMFADGKVALQATYGHLFTGSYIAKNLGTSTDQSWGYVQVWMNF